MFKIPTVFGLLKFSFVFHSASLSWSSGGMLAEVVHSMGTSVVWFPVADASDLMSMAALSNRYR